MPIQAAFTQAGVSPSGYSAMSRLPIRSYVPLLAAASVFTVLPGSGGHAAARVRSTDYVPGEALVCVRSTVTDDQVQALMLRQKATVLKRFAANHLYCVRLDGRRSTTAGIKRFALEREVAFCQPNYLYHARQTFPNDPYFPYLWGLHNTGQQSGTADADIDAPEAWDLTRGSRSVVVAVIDSGVDYGHPDLAANIWTNPGEIAGNGRDDDGNGYVDDVHGWDAADNDAAPLDENGHGTHVSGTIGALGSNNLGVVGVNWQVSIIPMRFLDADGSGTTADAIECIDYVNDLRDRGVNVIATNNSWGGTGQPDQALRDAIARANARDILFVAAAGNEGSNNDRTADYPANFDLANVISVAATDRNDRLADFSNYGATTVDLAAPGVEILSTVPRFLDPDLPYDVFSGTSMATPHVTGAAALLKAFNSSLTGAQIKARLLSTGDSLSDLQGRTVTGRRLNVYQALINDVSTPVPGPQLTVLVSTGRSYRIGKTATIKVKVADPATGRVVSGATVEVAIQTPGGEIYTAESLTGSTGYATFKFRLLRSDGKGTYLVTAEATKAGYELGTDSTTFLGK